MKSIIAVTLVVGLYGCSPRDTASVVSTPSPTAPVKVASSRGDLPEYEIVDVISGGLISLGPNDEVIYTSPAEPYDATNRAQLNAGTFDYLGPTTRHSKGITYLKSNGQDRPVRSDGFIDESGAVGILPDLVPIRETIDGKVYDLEPLRCPSLSTRYYQSGGNLFWREAKEKEIHRLSSAAKIESLIFKHGQLAASYVDSSNMTSISIFDDAGRQVGNFRDIQGSLIDFSGADAVLLRNLNGGTIITSSGKESLESGLPSSLIPVGSHLTAFGTYQKSPNEAEFCVWNSDGTIVPFDLLCPRISTLFVGRRLEAYQTLFLSNKRGTIALQVPSYSSNANDKELSRTQIVILHPRNSIVHN